MTPFESPVDGDVTEWIVDDGAVVEKDQQLMRIEVMKILYEVLAPCAGTVKFEAAPGDFVGQGQTLGHITEDY